MKSTCCNIDSNCVQILSSLDTAAIHPATHYPGERLGNVSRAAASVISDLMDEDNLLLDECNVYSVGYNFVCVLLEDTNHSSAGYLIKIVVHSINSDSWTHKLYDLLKEKKCNPIRFIKKESITYEK